jgi:hypothetical protein
VDFKIGCDERHAPAKSARDDNTIKRISVERGKLLKVPSRRAVQMGKNITVLKLILDLTVCSEEVRG